MLGIISSNLRWETPLELTNVVVEDKLLENWSDTLNGWMGNDGTYYNWEYNGWLTKEYINSMYYDYVHTDEGGCPHGDGPDCVGWKSTNWFADWLYRVETT